MSKTVKITILLILLLLIIIAVDVYLYISNNQSNKNVSKTLVTTSTAPVNKYNKLYEQNVGKKGSELITISKKNIESLYSNSVPIKDSNYPSLGNIFVGKYKELQNNNLILENNGKNITILLPSLFKLYIISDSVLTAENINPRIPYELSIFNSQVKIDNYLLLPNVEIDKTGIYRSDTIINFR